MSAKRKTVTLKFDADDLARIEKVATKSDRSVEDWMWSAVFCAVLSDEAHWEEMAARDAIRAAIPRDRFSILSTHLANLPGSVFDALADAMADERLKGRDEGAGSALRLAAVRGRS